MLTRNLILMGVRESIHREYSIIGVTAKRKAYSKREKKEVLLSKWLESTVALVSRWLEPGGCPSIRISHPCIQEREGLYVISSILSRVNANIELLLRREYECLAFLSRKDRRQ